MVGAGILSGDKLVIDRSRLARPGDIVVAVIHGEMTVKRLTRRVDGVHALLAKPCPSDQAHYPAFVIDEAHPFEILGRRLRRRAPPRLYPASYCVLSIQDCGLIADTIIPGLCHMKTAIRDYRTRVAADAIYAAADGVDEVIEELADMVSWLRILRAEGGIEAVRASQPLTAPQALALQAALGEWATADQ